MSMILSAALSPAQMSRVYDHDSKQGKHLRLFRINDVPVGDEGVLVEQVRQEPSRSLGGTPHFVITVWFGQDMVDLALYEDDAIIHFGVFE